MMYQLVQTSIIDDGHASYEGTSEVADAIVESSTTLTVDAHFHDTSDSSPELVKSSVSSQIPRYSLATLLIEDETVDSNVVTFSEPSEYPRADYVFMVVPTKSFFSESSESLAMI